MTKTNNNTEGNSAKSTKTTKSAKSTKSTKSAKSTSSKKSNSPKQIIKKFMENLPTTEDLIIKNKHKGIASIRLTISSVKDINNIDKKNIVNKDFNSIVKGLLKMNKKPLKFETKPSKFS